jgi:hypothetical protein
MGEVRKVVVRGPKKRKAVRVASVGQPTAQVVQTQNRIPNSSEGGNSAPVVGRLAGLLEWKPVTPAIPAFCFLTSKPKQN